MLLSIRYRFAKSKSFQNYVDFMLLLYHNAGPTIEENVGEGQGVLALSVDPSLNQPRCTSKITLMAPCNCIADISDVEVFQREKWQVAAFKFVTSNMS